MAGKTPRAVAVQAAVTAGLTSLAATALATQFASGEVHLAMSVASGAVVGVVCFLLVYRQLGLYIQDRVRIIYKTIRRLKGSTSHVHLDMGQDLSLIHI